MESIKDDLTDQEFATIAADSTKAAFQNGIDNLQVCPECTDCMLLVSASSGKMRCDCGFAMPWGELKNGQTYAFDFGGNKAVLGTVTERGTVIVLPRLVGK